MSPILLLLATSSLFLGNSATKLDAEQPFGWNLTATDVIRRTILPGYDRMVRPAETNETTPAKFSLTAIHVYIDEVKSTATLVGWMKILWHDKKLSWNAKEFKDTNVIRVSTEEIWKPDIELYNVATEPALVGTQAQILVYSDGKVLWVPPVKYEVLCKLNLKSWPRDTQTCRFVIGSWTYHSMILDMSFDNEGYEKIEQSWDENAVGRWKIKSIQTERLVQYYNCCAEPYTSLNYDITVERRGGAQVIINEVPVLALVVLLIAAAIKEPGSRMLLLVSVSLLSTICLLSLTIQFPNFGGSAPRIAIVYCALLVLSAVWGVTSSVAEWLSNTDNTTARVPGALRRFVKKSKLNVASDEDGVAMSPEAEKEVQVPSESLKDSWSELAKLFDRVFLAVGTLGLALVIVLSF